MVTAMRKHLCRIITLVFILALLPLSAFAEGADSYIFTLKPDAPEAAWELAERAEAVHRPTGVFLTDDLSLIRAIKSLGALDSYEKDAYIPLGDVITGSSSFLSLSAADTEYWAFKSVHADYAFDRDIDGSGVTIGIVDSGIAPEFPALSGATVLEGTNYTVSESSPDRHNTPDDVNHGTIVASVIADSTYGLAPGAAIVPFKAFSVKGSITSQVVAAIKGAVDYGCDIINMSFGGTHSSLSTALRESIDYAIQKGVILIAAAGNRSDDPYNYPEYPAAFPGVISVAMTTEKDAVSTGSVRNETVDIAAPGEKIIGRTNSGVYTNVSGQGDTGTSFASPMVAAAAALALSVKPDMTGEEFYTLLTTTATDIEETGYDIRSGFGLLNVEGMLKPLVGWYSNEEITVDSEYFGGEFSFHIPAAETIQHVFMASYRENGRFLGVSDWTLAAGETLTVRGCAFSPRADTYSIFTVDGDHLPLLSLSGKCTESKAKQ